MNTKDALGIVLPLIKDEDIALFTTGMISRHAFNLKDRMANFYMIGSMGLLSSLGLGIALNSKNKVVIFDGDGSLMMNMGTMAMIVHHRPENLFHIVLDNECYESTGGQPTVSGCMDFAKVAGSIGYNKVFRFQDVSDLKGSISSALSESGPVFILLKVTKSQSDKEPQRVSVAPLDIAARIKSSLTR